MSLAIPSHKCGGSGGGSDVWLYAHVCPCMYAACSELKMGQHQCASPFGWTDQPEPPTPYPPKAGSRPNPKSRKKIARLAYLTPTPSEEGERNLFHLLSVGCPGSRLT